MRLKWTIEYLDVQPLIPLNSKNFPNDQLVVYQGFYGVPSYVIWYARPYPEKPRQFKLSNIFNVTLHTTSTSAPFIETFKIRSVIYEPTKKMWRIFAISSRWDIMSTTNDIQYFEYPQETSGIEIIKDALWTVLPLCKTIYDKKELDNYYRIKYKYVAFDKTTTILDIISKVCKENNWEWYFAHDNLYVSPSLWLDPKLLINNKGSYVTDIAKEREHTKDAIDWDFRALTIDATGAEPMTMFNNRRIIWVKYMLGESIGDLMTIMCQNPTGTRESKYPYVYISEMAFYERLTGVAKDLAAWRMNRLYREMPVIAGRIFGDVNDPNDYQAPKFSGRTHHVVKNWDTRKYFNEDNYANKKNIPKGDYAEKARITTPYAGDGVGMLFPQEKDQHRLMFSPNGERDMPLVGPGFYAEEEKIPVRGSEKEFRFQLPNGWALVTKENGNTILQIAGADSQTEVTEVENGEVGILLQNEPQKEIYLTVDNASAIEFVEGSGGGLVAVIEGTISLQADKGAIEIFSANGEVTINSISKTAYFKGPSVKIEGGSVEINGTKFLPGGVIKCTLLTTDGGVLPPNIL